MIYLQKFSTGEIQKPHVPVLRRLDLKRRLSLEKPKSVAEQMHNSEIANTGMVGCVYIIDDVIHLNTSMLS